MFPALPFSRTTRAPRTVRAFPGTSTGATVAGAVLALTTGCGILSPAQNGDMPDDINVTSPLMQGGEPLPAAYSCEGQGEGGEEGGERAPETYSPPLSWSGLPDGTGSIALVVDDPHVAQVFWVVYDLDPQLVELRQNTVPADAKQAQNSTGESSYDPPCPEPEEAYEYRFTVYALRNPLDLPDGATLDASLDAIAEQAMARGSLVTSNTA